MLDRKSLVWFLLIAFGLSWILFVAPLAVKGNETLFPAVMKGLFAVAMWGPGVAAIVSTRFVARQPLASLRLRTLGPRRWYFWAWALPLVIVVLTFGISLLLPTVQLDTTFGVLRTELEKASQTGQSVPSAEVAVVSQIALALTLAPFINVVFALGEELGWRGFLLPKLLPLGQWKAMLLTGFIWGVWHAPTTIFYGYNFALHPYLGVLVGLVGFTLLGIIMAWLYLKTHSPWAPALGHGAFNAVAGLSFFFLKPDGLDTALAGSPLGLAGWLATGLVILALLWLRQFPPQEAQGAQRDDAPA